MARNSEESVGLNNSVADEEFKYKLWNIKENYKSIPASGDQDYMGT